MPPHGDKRWSSALWAVREVDHLFGRFARYTRFVLFSKWLLVAVALLLIASLIAWPLITKDRSGIRISFVDNNTASKKPTSPVMENPEYRGVGNNSQQYKVNGLRATQKSSELVVIDQVESQMLKSDGKWYSLTADRGEFQQDKKLMDLFGNVTLLDMQATSFVTSRATIETQNMRVYGNEKITGSGAMGNIVASGFEITDNGNHIIFKGGSRQLKVIIDRKKSK